MPVLLMDFKTISRCNEITAHLIVYPYTFSISQIFKYRPKTQTIKVQSVCGVHKVVLLSLGVSAHHCAQKADAW